MAEEKPKRMSRVSRASKSAAKSVELASADKPTESLAKTVKVLSGCNPQIGKGDGDAPVRAYIESMPGWKREIGQRLDALIVHAVPSVQKAVRWNSPFYGAEGKGWFLGIHCFTKYLKVTFFQGMSLVPIPPGGTERSKDARWIDIREDESLDEELLAEWIRQAAALPGWSPGRK